MDDRILLDLAVITGPRTVSVDRHSHSLQGPKSLATDNPGDTQSVSLRMTARSGTYRPYRWQVRLAERLLHLPLQELDDSLAFVWQTGLPKPSIALQNRRIEHRDHIARALGLDTATVARARHTYDRLLECEREPEKNIEAAAQTLIRICAGEKHLHKIQRMLCLRNPNVRPAAIRYRLA